MNTKLIGFIALGLITIILCGGIGYTFAQGSTPGSTDPIGGVTPKQIPEKTADDIMKIIGKIVNWIFTFLMLVVVIMILVAGYMFVTGGANPESVTKARSILMYALIGFAIAMLAKGLIALVAAFLGAENDVKGFPFVG